MVPRGEIEVKGKGKMHTWFLNARVPKYERSVSTLNTFDEYTIRGRKTLNGDKTLGNCTEFGEVDEALPSQEKRPSGNQAEVQAEESEAEEIASGAKISSVASEASRPAEPVDGVGPG